MVWAILQHKLGEQGWRSGESSRLPLMWFGFKSRRRRHLWVEFVVSSPLAWRGFSADTPDTLLKNQHFQIPIRSGTQGHVSTISSRTLKCFTGKQITIYGICQSLSLSDLFLHPCIRNEQ